MGLLSGIVLLPLAPVRGVVRLAELIQEQVEQELHNPANTRRQLEELEEARERGEISADEEKRAQEQILQTRVKPAAAETPPPEEG
jgi:Gas vesicle protein G